MEGLRTFWLNALSEVQKRSSLKEKQHGSHRIGICAYGRRHRLHIYQRGHVHLDCATNNAVNGTWNTAADWSPSNGAAPGSNDSVQFNDTSSGKVCDFGSGSYSVNGTGGTGLVFGGALADTFTMQNGTLSSLGTGGVLNVNMNASSQSNLASMAISGSAFDTNSYAYDTFNFTSGTTHASNTTLDRLHPGRNNQQLPGALR